MKTKKALSMLIACSMALSMLSVPAYAEGEGGDPGGSISVDITIGSADNPIIVDGPNVTGPGEDGNATIVDNGDGTITTTTDTEKSWFGGTETESGYEVIQGSESATDTSTTESDTGDLVNQNGSAVGAQEHTFMENGNDTDTEDSAENETGGFIYDESIDGNPSISMTPGSTAETTGNISVTVNPDSIPDWVINTTDSSTTVDLDNGTISSTEYTSNDNSDGTTDVTIVKTDTDPNTGEVTVTTVTMSRDSNGNVINYNESVTTTSTSSAELPDQSEFKDSTATVEQVFEAPERPSTTNDQTVFDLTDDAGNLVGYIVVTYDPATGDVVDYDCTFGCWYEVTTKTEDLGDGMTKTTVTKTTSTTTSTNNYGTINNGGWIVISGSMSDVIVGDNNGNYTFISPQPTQGLLDQTFNWDGYNINDHLGILYTSGSSTRGDALPEDGKLWYVGTGLSTNILLNYVGSDGQLHRTPWVHQFQLVDSEGNYFYAYCADWDTTALKDSQYTITNIWDAYYLDDTAKSHIQAIAEYGFWGTESGTNSLDDVKALIADSGYSDYVDEGIALAVTQAAIWYYANRTEMLSFGDSNGDLLSYWMQRYGNVENCLELTDNEKAAANKLFSALINKQSDASNVTSIIESGDLKNVEVTVLDKVDNIDDVTREVANITSDTEVFNTDLAFTIAVVPDQINGDVTVYVYQGVGSDGNPIIVDSMKLSSDNTYTNNGKSVSMIYDADTKTTTYKINGLQLQENVDINLSIQGVQNLNGGAYLFTSTGEDSMDGEESQTLIGLIGSTSTRNVDIGVSLNFNVDSGTNTGYYSDSSKTENITWTATYSTTVTPPENPPENPPTPPENPPEEPPENPPTPPTTPPEEPPTVPPETPEVPEEPVTPEDRLDDVPKTGDQGIGMHLITAISSMCGMIYISRKKDDEENI